MQDELTVLDAPGGETPPDTTPATKPASADSGESNGRKGGDQAPEGRDELKALKRELARMKDEVKALSESERYWAAQAKAKTDAKPAPAADDDDGGDDDLGGDDAIDLLSTKGLSALRDKGFLTERGAKRLVKQVLETRLSAEQAKIDALVEERLQAKIQSLTGTAQLVQEYPDLGVPESDLYVLTQEKLEQMVREEPALKGSKFALQAAAREAAQELGLGRKQNEREARMRRIQGQLPERGAPRRGDDYDDGDLIEPDPAIAKLLQEAGASVDDWRKERRLSRRTA
jgi:hypothetical protein